MPRDRRSSPRNDRESSLPSAAKKTAKPSASCTVTSSRANRWGVGASRWLPAGRTSAAVTGDRAKADTFRWRAALTSRRRFRVCALRRRHYQTVRVCRPRQESSARTASHAGSKTSSATVPRAKPFAVQRWVSTASMASGNRPARPKHFARSARCVATCRLPRSSRLRRAPARKPEASAVTALLGREERSKTRVRSVSGMPEPVSVTESAT